MALWSFGRPFVLEEKAILPNSVFVYVLASDAWCVSQPVLNNSSPFAVVNDPTKTVLQINLTNIL